MLTTKLILIEGLPGAGKSTTTVHLGEVLREHGLACRAFQEEDKPHPIPCLDLEIKGLAHKLIPMWRDFAHRAEREEVITIIESRLWQNTALFMYMSEAAEEEIRWLNRQVAEALALLSPVLFHLDQEDTKSALRQMYARRGEKWMQQTLRETTVYPWFKRRGLRDFHGWVLFFEEWQRVAERLFNDWPHAKLKIMNSQENWAWAYRQMETFLELSPSR